MVFRMRQLLEAKLFVPKTAIEMLCLAFRQVVNLNFSVL